MKKGSFDAERIERLLLNLDHPRVKNVEELRRLFLKEVKAHGVLQSSLFEATLGKHKWNDPGMGDFERGWEPFVRGARVEVRTHGDIWRPGTVRKSYEDTERGIHVECDVEWSNNTEFYNRRGCIVMAYLNTRRGILSNIRMIDVTEQAGVSESARPHRA